jgi:O-6-methylguanine DNA methyltransferase
MCIRQADGAYAAPYRTSWGEGWLYVRDAKLTGVDLPDRAAGPCMAASPAPAAGCSGAQAASTGAAGAEPAPACPGAQPAPSRADEEALTFWVRELEAYFSGERATWTPAEVQLEHLGLPAFDRAVYETLLAVPPGETLSYGELAELAGFPRAARAVGNAMASNPIPVVVPCHRVVRSDGTLGNYGNDPRWKERLLLHEGWPRVEGS